MFKVACATVKIARQPVDDMKKEKFDMFEITPDDEETEEQFSVRVRTAAKKRLVGEQKEFDISAVQAGMSLSRQSSFFGDLTRKPDLGD